MIFQRLYILFTALNMKSRLENRRKYVSLMAFFKKKLILNRHLFLQMWLFLIYLMLPIVKGSIIEHTLTIKHRSYIDCLISSQNGSDILHYCLRINDSMTLMEMMKSVWITEIYVMVNGT